MNREDVIRMAREAGLVDWLPNSNFSDGIWWIDAHEVGSELEAFAALIASAEREEILAFASSEAFNRQYGEKSPFAYELANAIRAKGQA